MTTATGEANYKVMIQPLDTIHRIKDMGKFKI